MEQPSLILSFYSFGVMLHRRDGDRASVYPVDPAQIALEMAMERVGRPSIFIPIKVNSMPPGSTPNFGGVHSGAEGRDVFNLSSRKQKMGEKVV